MAHTERFPRRHPLCTCPEITFASLDKPRPPVSECAGGTIAHPPPLDLADLKALVAAYREPRQEAR